MHLGNNLRRADMENQDAYQRAKKRVEAKIGFYVHLAVYVIVNILLMIINLTTSRQYLWFQWPLIGWGIGLLFHGLGVFIFSGRSPLKEKMIQKEIEKEIPRKM
jgi:hypothetical protein